MSPGLLEGSVRRGFLELLRSARHTWFNRRELHSDADVEDLVQEALLATSSKSAAWRRPGPIGSWSFATACDRCRDPQRQSARAQRRWIISDLLLLNTGDEGVVKPKEPRPQLASLSVREPGFMGDIGLSGYPLAETNNRVGKIEGATKTGLQLAIKTLITRVGDREN
jgi:DNA-directed RNA polymerase specialized sigma24 family protein